MVSKIIKGAEILLKCFWHFRLCVVTFPSPNDSFDPLCLFEWILLQESRAKISLGTNTIKLIFTGTNTVENFR